MRICWFRKNFSLEVDFPALKFPWSQEIFQDANQKSEISENQSYHFENKFHQYDLTVYIGKCGNGIDVFNGSLLISLQSLQFLQELRRGCQILWIVEDCGGSSFFRKWSFKNVSWRSRKNPCFTSKSRIAARHGPWTRKRRGLTGNAGRSRAATVHDRNLLRSVTHDFEPIIDSVRGFLSWCKDNSSLLALLVGSNSSKQVLLKSSISCQSFAWFYRKSPHFHFSMQA